MFRDLFLLFFFTFPAYSDKFFDLPLSQPAKGGPRSNLLPGDDDDDVNPVSAITHSAAAAWEANLKAPYPTPPVSPVAPSHTPHQRNGRCFTFAHWIGLSD
jgi:hypothetical protein